MKKTRQNGVRRLRLAIPLLIGAFAVAPPLWAGTPVPVRVMISSGYAAAFEELVPRFEAASGIGVVIIHGPSMGAAPQSIPNRLARGEAEIGFQQLSELQPIKGITIAGLLPAEVQKATTFSAGIVKGAANEKAGQDLIRFLASQDAKLTIQRAGMAPVKAAQ